MRSSVLIFRSIISLLLALGVVGCATQQPPLANDMALKIKRVAVISMTADSFTRQYVGFTVFGNEKEVIDISDWKIDRQYEDQFRNELEHGYGIDVAQVSYPMAAFKHVNDLKGPWDAPAFWGPNWDAIASATKKVCSDNSLDAVLVVAKTKSRDFISGTNQVLDGAGIYSRGPINKVAVLHLLSKVGLLDCTTGKPLATRLLASRQSGLPGEIARSIPLVPIPFEKSHISIHQWMPEQTTFIRDELSRVPKWAIKATLKSMLPAPGELQSTNKK